MRFECCLMIPRAVISSGLCSVFHREMSHRVVVLLYAMLHVDEIR